VDFPAPEAGSLLANFTGLPHRLQLIGRRYGVRYVNDSKSTTPAATRLAVAAFEDSRRVHLIAGGHDKQVDLAPIASLAPTLGGLYTIGVTGPVIAELTPPGAPVEYCHTLDRAVAEARRRARDGDVVLLSPGCASWDQFDHFEARGREFERLVEEERRGGTEARRGEER
jgi:UDP-N-acetylmuramoylalanine--D-glutamate ligase